MKISFILTALICAGFATTASAEKVPFHTPSQLKAKCDKVGGSYTPPNENGVYMCEFEGVIGVCGGVGEYAKTCGTVETRALPAARLGQLRSNAATGVFSVGN